jgi:N-acetylglucosamine-6-phosphate deacetylase
MDERMLLVRGARFEAGGSAVSILLRGGRIVAVSQDADRARGLAATRALEADGLLAAPGFIDLQVNGAAGVDLTEDPAGIWAVGATLSRFGVTAFLPTIVTSPAEVLDAARRVLVAGPPPGFVGALPLGLHLEGPFLAHDRRGVHAASHLAPPDRARAASWSPSAGVRMVTLAPELPGSMELVRDLVGRGVVVAAGHSAASWEDACAGIDVGVRYATHLFNAMRPLHHRDPGLVAALLLDPRVIVGLIPDGIHVHPAIIELAWRLAGPGRVSVVTDAMAGLGMPPGGYALAGRDVDVSEGRAQVDGHLAGGVLSLDGAIRNLRTWTGASTADVIATVSRVPARLLGLDGHRGDLALGQVADLVLLTDGLEVVTTIVGGIVAYDAGLLGVG